jgi:hypothetical protein
LESAVRLLAKIPIHSLTFPLGTITGYTDLIGLVKVVVVVPDTSSTHLLDDGDLLA